MTKRMRSCRIHQAEHCVYCVWLASGDPVKIHAAASRAARVAAGPQPISYDGYRPENSVATEPATVDHRNRFRWVKAMKACGARVKAGCGCQDRFECRLREHAVVSPEECRVCLETRAHP